MSLNSLLTTSSVILSNFLILNIPPIQRLDSEEREYGLDSGLLWELDGFIYQNIAETNKFSAMLSTSRIKEKLRKDCKTICFPNAYFEGYFPQNTANPNNPYIEEYGNGPFPQGDINIIKLHDQVDVTELSRIISSNDFYSEKECMNNVKKTLEELRKRETVCDITISDFIEENYQNEYLFYTVNHPTNRVLAEELKRIFRLWGYEINDVKELAAIKSDGWQTFIYPSVAHHLHLQFYTERFCYWKRVKAEASNMNEYVEDYLKLCFGM